ncbi:MAG: ABC transporter substrate-binding protein, partial [Firmicutes bacterium]|nr:ABC transporter substrate-binding protein [Bacillota bacterium]
MVYARPVDASTLDPAFLQDDSSARVTVNIFEGLVQFKPGTTDVQPCLAESWRVSADGREWIFHLRKNVFFHDGTPFNAEAVRFSIERQLTRRDSGKMPYASFTFGPIEEILTPDPYTVKFVLKYPYAPFLRNLAMAASAPIVSPSAVQSSGEDFKPVGTGPYVFESWHNGKLVLKANKSYWGDAPRHDRLIFRVIRQSRFRALALKLGMVDIIEGIEPADARYLEQNGVPVLRRPGMDINYMGFYTDKKPFDNPSVRKALNMAIDKEHIVSILYKANAFPAKGPLPPGVPGYNENLRSFPYDPEGARKILKSAGFSDGLTITLITYENPRPYNPAGGVKLAETVREDLAKVGVNAHIKSYTWEKYKEALLNREGDAFFYGWTGDNGDPDNFLFTLFASSQIEGGLNAFHYRNKE